jgi:copper chaperone
MADSTHIVLNVPSISCKHCKMAIEGALAGLEGVSTAVVDVGAQSVDLVYDHRRVDRERIEAVIDAEGYAIAGVHVFED